MEFLRPGLLWGLLALGVPVLIHLMGQRRLRTVPIATLRFLERARARAAAHLKLRRILLLLARTIALGCLAFLYAGPGCRTRGAGAPGPSTWVLVLDTSPSMEASRGGPSRLAEAKQALRAALGEAGPEDRFLLATTLDSDTSAWKRGFSADIHAVRREVEDARVEYGPHRADRALESAFALLEGVGGGRLVLATDLQASPWGEGKVAGAGTAPLQILDVGLQDARNTWIDSVDEGESGVRVRLGSMGPPGEGRRTVRLTLGDGNKLTAFFEGDETLFQMRLPSSAYAGAALVTPGGDLGPDDELAFVGRGRAKTRVLLLNGDPRGFEILDELLFVRRALVPATRLGERFDVREMRLAEATAADLADVDVFLVANPGPLSPELAAALLLRVQEGAGLVVTAGDRWKPGAEMAGDAAQVLAARPRDAVAIPPDDPGRRPFEPLDTASLAGPLALFRDRAAGDLSGVRVERYWVLEARAGEGIEVWMRLENGVPLLVERKIGAGRSLILTTTVDRGGADLCLQPVFIPWLERVLLHAAGRLQAPLDRWAVAGQPVALPYSGDVVVEGPGAKKAAWSPKSPPFVPPEPGVYRITSGAEAMGAFVARISAGESDLTRLTSGALDSRLGKGTYSLGAGSTLASGMPGKAGRADASVAYAVALLALLAAEAGLSCRWFGRRKRPVIET